MADTTKKRRVVKKTATIREQAAKAANAQPKPRRVRKTVSKASTPLRKLMQFVAKLLKPFSFLLIPFKTRPVRFLGRTLARVLAINYFIQSWKELRQVTWPNARETFKLTVAVFLFAVIFSVLIAVVDYGLDKLFKELILG